MTKEVARSDINDEYLRGVEDQKLTYLQQNMVCASLEHAFWRAAPIEIARSRRRSPTDLLIASGSPQTREPVAIAPQAERACPTRLV